MSNNKTLTGYEAYDDHEMENQLKGIADQLSQLKTIVNTEESKKENIEENKEDTKEMEEYEELKNRSVEKLENENNRLEKENRMLNIELRDQKNINNALMQSQITDLENLEKEIEALKILLEKKIEMIDDLNKQLESTKKLGEQQLSVLQKEKLNQIKANKLIQEKNDILTKENADIQHLKHMVDQLKKEKQNLSKEMELVKVERDENKLTVLSNALDTVQLKQMNDQLTKELKIERDHARRVPSKKEDVDLISRQIAYMNTFIQRDDDWVMIDPTRICCMCKKPMTEAVNSNTSCCLCQLLHHIVDLKTKDSPEIESIQPVSDNKMNVIQTKILAALVGIIFLLVFIVISK